MNQWRQRSGLRSDGAMDRTLQRKLNRRALVGAGAATAAGLAGGSGFGAYAAPDTRLSRTMRLAQTEEGIRGGRMRIATTGQPAGLDNQLVGQRTITLITWNMYEALFTFDGDYATVPMLAEGI